MLRKIIRIDRGKCDGCGRCASACHEGAIGLADDGRAVLLRDDYCDGLGDCLPACPAGAIAFETREAPAYDEEAVKKSRERLKSGTLPCGCPGSDARALERGEPGPGAVAPARAAASQLAQWPVQIKLVPVRAPYFENADLLVAADCAAYACGNFHGDFMRGRVTLIGCPKLDEGDYGEKLAAVIRANDIKSVTVARMEVPCCGGLEYAVKTALENSGRRLPGRTAVIPVNGGPAKESLINQSCPE